MTRLLVVDDSALMRRLIGSAFADEPEFEIAFARDGVEGLAAAKSFRPHVATLDVQMPGLDGLACLDRIMVEAPCRVVMVSALTADGADATLRALELGAVDFVEKPAGAVSLAMDSFAPRLVQAVRAACAAQLSPALRLAERVRRQVAGARPASALRRAAAPRPHPVDGRPRPAGGKGLVLVGCSTGGPPALEVLLGALPGDLAWPIVVAQHMPASFTGALARRLDRLCELQIREIADVEPLRPGAAYIARGDADVLVSRRGAELVGLSAPPLPDGRWRPSVDRLVESALALAPAERLAGVLMTGMGDDGAAAMTRLHARGGATLAEAEESAVVWGMPGALVRAGGAGEVAPLEALAALLVGKVGVA